MRSKAWLPSVALTFIALVLLSSAALAAPPSPFVGHWQTIDTDGSDIRLTIAGRGPYQVTWTESFFSYCSREAGIARGTAAISANPNVLVGDLFLQCFTVEESIFFSPVWTYDSGTDTMSSPDGQGGFAVWHRPGR